MRRGFFSSSKVFKEGSIMQKKPAVKISIQDLIAYVFQSGDIDAKFRSNKRMVEGIKGHQAIQSLKPAGYQTEVPIVFTVKRDQFDLEINGRIDGLMISEEDVIIEEIKTTRRFLQEISEDDFPAHWAQAKSYAYIYALQNQLEKIKVKLTYYQLDSKLSKSFVQLITLDELELFFTQVLKEYLDWAETIHYWLELRNASIAQLTFPYQNYRQGQREMAVNVYKAIVGGEKLFVEAPTGIGKTLATLFPAIKALGVGESSKIFYLTAKTITRTVAENALDKLRLRGIKIKSITITAKEKVCLNSQLACDPQSCPYAKGYYDRVKVGIKDIFQQDAFTRQVIQEYAEKYCLCPFEFSLDLAFWADCIICDYNYAFDPQVYLRRFFLDQGKDYTFLIDEAHNLVDRAREMFSAELKQSSIITLQQRTKTILPEISNCLTKINDFLQLAQRICTDLESSYHVQIEPPKDLYPILKKFIQFSESWLVKGQGAPIYEEMLEVFFSVRGFLRTLEVYDDRYVTLVKKSNDDLKLKLFCLDPSFQLTSTLKQSRATIFFSATLTPMNYFTQVLTGEETVYQSRFSSPFPRSNQCLLINDQISTKYHRRASSYEKLIDLISAVVKVKVGNYLVFFPSYQYMNQVHQLFCEQNSEIKVICQQSGMSEKDREVFLAEFTTEAVETLVGFAVMGGIFGEGIDLVGERLSGVVIVGVGLPQICPEREIIRNYYEEKNGQGFEYAYIYPGMIRVLQALGRVIRTEEDRGVVVLVDQRFGSVSYQRLYPAEWQPVKRVRDCLTITRFIENFWQESV